MKYKNCTYGMIPTDWEEVLIDDLVNNSIIEKPLDGNHGNIHPTADDFVTEGIPFVMANSVYNGILDLTVCNFIRKEQADKLQKGFSIEGDILLTHKGSVGNVAIVKGINTDYIMLTPQVTYYRIKKHDKLERAYLKAFFESECFQNLLRIRSGGGTRAYIGITNQRQLPIVLPPLPEQKAIAQVLSTADAAIHTTEKLITQKELRKKWLMQQLLTGKKRLKGFDGEWKKERLEKYLVKHDEKTITNNQYPVLTSSRKGIFLQSDYYTRDVASEDNTGYNVVPRGYFTYRHMSDDLIFKFNINDIVDKGIVSTLYPVFTTKGINDYFLLAKLNEGNEFKMHAGEQKQGGSRTYVYFNTLCQLKLNMPSIEEQTAIAQVLQAADKEISLLKTKAEKLREQKKGLMQVLLTGKVRLKINKE